MDEYGALVPSGGGGGGGGGASSSSGKKKNSSTKKAKSAAAAAASEDEEELDDEDDDDYEAPAEDAEEAVGAKRLRGAGGRPAPTLADKKASAAQKVATALSAEVAAKKGADKASSDMQKFKDAHPGPVATLLGYVRGIVGQQNWTHAQTITFLNNSSKGFAVRARAHLPAHACPHACTHSLPTPTPTCAQMWADVKHAQIKSERATATRVEAEDIKSKADEAAAAAEEEQEEGGGSSSAGADSQALW